jgi:hypothetical protein
MGGDVLQWNEADVLGDYRGIRGGEYDYAPDELASSTRIWAIPPAELDCYGFRVAASVPEPSTITLLLVSAACLLAFTWRRRLVA